MKAQPPRIRRSNIVVTNKNVISPLKLNTVIKTTFPLLKRQEIKDLQTHIIDYISKGLADGYDIALIKRETNPRTKDEELKLRILKLKDDPND